MSVIIGLTGQSGAGKSTASRIFADRGFFVINADNEARYVMQKGQPCLEETILAFGSEYLLPDGELDRRKLGAAVFADRKKLDRLEEITYPHINRRVEYLIEINSDKEFILLDAPTLFEAGEDKLCRYIAAVTAGLRIRTQRIAKRDGITPEQALKRFESQHGEDFFRERADYIIENSGSPDELVKRTNEIIDNIIKTIGKER